jgi:hypothetical protein
MNYTESFKSNLNRLHTRNGQRFRAYHRAGQLVCGNSNQYYHLNVWRNVANHRKIDLIRMCQYQIRQYTKTELAEKTDVMEACAGIASYYAGTTAKIVSLAGIQIPFPIAKLSDGVREQIDHLSYALASTNHIHKFSDPNPESSTGQSNLGWEDMPWTPYDNPRPQRRVGFPSWSWAGWFGEIRKRNDLPYCWSR